MPDAANLPPGSPPGQPAVSGNLIPTNNLAREIVEGFLRSLALVFGALMVGYAVWKLHDNATLITIGGTLITFATGGSALNKVAADSKFNTALYTKVPDPTQS